MYADFKPINDGVLVKLMPKETKTATGLFIPDDAQENTQQATVVHPGNSKQVALGDKVFCKKYTGHILLDDEYMVIREEDILGVL